MAPEATQKRREAIRRLIQTRRISTQEELGKALAREGLEVNQATLSRDLAQLGAIRASAPQGGTSYAFRDDAARLTLDQLRHMADLVLTLQDNGALVVIHTQPGAASAVARAVDLQQLDEALGTIAGDDTIFIAPQKGKSTRKLTGRLLKLFGKQEA